MGIIQSKQSISIPIIFPRTFPNFIRFIEIAPGFFNLRLQQKVAGGTVNAGTHMSVVRITDGNYVALDCVSLDAIAKSELDTLTSGGTRLVACLMTHPFHTKYIKGFHAMYPSNENRRYYGCPRHVANFEADELGLPIVWFGNLQTACSLDTFEPALSMRIPAGAEFVNPRPANFNHFSNVVIYHRASKTVHTNDLIMFWEKPGFLRLFGIRSRCLHFHFSMLKGGLFPTVEAPLMFREWVVNMLFSWDFENLVCAHNGICYGDAKELLLDLIEKAAPALDRLSMENASSKADAAQRTHDFALVNTEETECG